MQAKKLTKLASALLLVLGGILSSSAFAADTVCSIVYDNGEVIPVTDENGPDIVNGTTPVPDTTIAVASNFYAPAIEVAGFFLNSNVGESYTAIGVCHNATGHLSNEITGQNPPVIDGEWLSAKINYKYGLFMAANASAPVNLHPSYKIGSPMVYANGIPALLVGSSLGIQNPVWTDLLTSAPNSPVSGTFYNSASTPSSGSTGPVVMNLSNLSKVAIASPSAAPYGNAAKNIITAMGQWPASTTPMPGNNPGACTADPTSTQPGICVYDNIDITYTETGNSNLKAGWVAWAQIISDENVGLYITFPSEIIPQKAVQLTCPYPGSNAAEDFWNFMNLAAPNAQGDFYAAADDRTWNDWLADRGYGAITPPTSAKKKQ
jgi:ABC-type molybdate transport system substrate-binding protein